MSVLPDPLRVRVPEPVSAPFRAVPVAKETVPVVLTTMLFATVAAAVVCKVPPPNTREPDPRLLPAEMLRVPPFRVVEPV